MALRKLGHVREQFDLHVFFRSEVCEQPALGRPDLLRQHAERNAGKTRLTHQGEAVLQYSLAGGN